MTYARNEDAYGIDADARQKINEAGFDVTGENEGLSRVFLSSARSDLRVVMTPGDRSGGVLNFGDLQLQQRVDDAWKTRQEISKQGFAAGEQEFKISFN